MEPWGWGVGEAWVIRCGFPRNFDGLIPDAPELIHTYLEGEQDASCKRNAFMMLIHVDRVSGDSNSGVRVRIIRSCVCCPVGQSP